MRWILSVNRKEKPEVNALYLFELCTRLMEIAKKEYCLALHAVVGSSATSFPTMSANMNS